MIISAAIHDIDHRGVNNTFLINTKDSLALIYNDFSVQENNSISKFFTLINNE